MRAGIPTFLAVFLAGSFPAGVMAQWTQAYGPSGTQVTALAMSGPHLIASVPYLGIYFSTDEGKRWSFAESFPFETTFTCFASLGADLFAGTLEGKVYRSSNRGVNWEAASDLPGSETHSPDAAIVSLVAHGGYLFASSDGGVFRTGDRGETWSQVTLKLPSGDRVNNLLSQGASLIVGTDRHWLYASTDQGAQWTRLAAPPEVENYGGYPVAAAGDWIYAGCGSFLLRSSNQGKTWSQVTGLPTSMNSASAIVQVGSDLLALMSNAGVYRSEDGGVTWLPSAVGLPKSASFGHLVVTGSRVLLATDTDGMFASSDEGRSWTLSGIGLPIMNVIRTLVADGTDAFATTYGEIYRSRDGGSAWAGMDFPSLGPGGHTAKINSVIFWGGDLVLSGGKGVWRHRDGAASPWSQVGTGLPSSEINLVAAAGPTLLAGTFDSIYVLDLKDSIWKGIPKSPGMYFDDDGGLVSLDGVHLSGGTYGGIFRSVEGQAWSLVTEGLPSPRVDHLAVYGKRVFAIFGGLYRSEDKGLTWIPSGSGIPKTEVRALASNGRLLFAGTRDQGVFMSSDNGSSWTALTPGYPTGELVGPLAVNDQHIYASLASGLWRFPLPGAGTGLKALRAIRHGRHKALRADAAGRTIRPDQSRPGPAYFRN